MIITINNDDGTISYAINHIADEQAKANAHVTTTKVGQLQTI